MSLVTRVARRLRAPLVRPQTGLFKPADPATLGAPTILFINDTRDQSNWGSQALADTLTDVFAHSLPGRHFAFIPSYSLFPPSADRPMPEVLLPQVADQFEYVADEWLAGRGGPHADEFIAALPGFMVAVFNGEGSVYRRNYSAIKALFLLWFAKTRFGIPALFLNGGVHLTLVEPILPAMVRKTFSAIDMVAVREPYSQRNLHDFTGIQATVIPDSAFHLSRELVHKSAKGQQWRERLAGREYFCFSAGQMAFDYRYRQRSALYELIAKMKTLVPQAVLVAKEPDDQYLEQVARETGSLFFGPEHSYQDLMALLSNATFQLSGRYHHLIVATVVGCPSIAFAGLSHKVHGLCELLQGRIGQPYDSSDLRRSMPEILTAAHAHSSNLPDRRRELRDVADRLRAATGELGDMIRTVAATKG